MHVCNAGGCGMFFHERCLGTYYKGMDVVLAAAVDDGGAGGGVNLMNLL